jgi:hypothetical protein
MTSARAFSTLVKLPCTVSCGAGPVQKVAGMAIKIGPESMVLHLGAGSRSFPRVGEKVGLEVHLPVNFEPAGAKDLSIRGVVVGVKEMRDGARQFVLNFRRANFKDRRAGKNGAEPPKSRRASASDGWEM